MGRKPKGDALSSAGTVELVVREHDHIGFFYQPHCFFDSTLHMILQHPFFLLFNGLPTISLLVAANFLSSSMAFAAAAAAEDCLWWWCFFSSYWSLLRLSCSPPGSRGLGCLTLDIDLCFPRSDRVWEVEADAAVAGDDLAPPPVGAGGAGGLPW